MEENGMEKLDETNVFIMETTTNDVEERRMLFCFSFSSFFYNIIINY